MIVVWGLEDDAPVAGVLRALAALGVPFAFVDQRDVLASRFDVEVDHGFHGRLDGPTWSIDLEAVSAVYVRSYSAADLAAVVRAGSSADQAHARAVEETLLSWADVSPALVVNRPSAMASNNSKPYQASLIRSYGFDVPETLVTSDAAAVRAFWERHGTVVYKSMSGVRSQVARLTAEHFARFDTPCACPTQFQAYVPGHDHRVHVLGADVFNCEIVSDADDYRYGRRTMRPYELPVEIADRSEQRVDASVVGDVIAEVRHRRGEDR